MGMPSYPRFRQIFRVAELLKSVGQNPATVVPCIPLHVEPKQSWPAFIGRVQEPRFSQIDTSNYAADIGILADVIITDGAASRKSMHRQDRGGRSIHPEIMGIP